MNARRLTLVLALASLDFGACGSDGGGGGGDDIPAPGQSLAIITVIYNAGVPEVRQIWVTAHASGQRDVDLRYPMVPAGPIKSGSTLGILVPNAIGTMLDLTLRGLDAGQNPVARGTGQAILVPDSKVEKTITLDPCGTSGTPGC
jgi:hypothetical protein